MNLEEITFPKRRVFSKISDAKQVSSRTKINGGKKGKMKGTLSSSFEKYLDFDMPNADSLALRDLEMEKKLGRKLKVKGGKLTGADDGLNMLFEEFPTEYEALEEELHDSEDISDGFMKETPVSKNLSDELEEEETSGSDKFSIKRPLNSLRKRHNKRMASERPEDDQTVLASDLNEPQNIIGKVQIPTTSTSHKKHKRSPKHTQEGDLAAKIASESQADQINETGLNICSAKAIGLQPVNYVVPHLRSQARNELEDQTQIRRRIRGLLNKLSESNVDSITGEIATVFRSVSRNVSSQITCEEVLASCHNGPRGNEQHAAVFAAFVAGIASLVGIDFGAKLLSLLALSFEEEYLKQDNQSLRNLTLLLSYLCKFGVCASDIIYDFMIVLSTRLSETDVSTILTILQCCGMKIRADDPAAMKSFILSVQNRVNELKASSEDGQKSIFGRRMEFMLETICDIKNNKKKSNDDTLQHTRMKKWLQNVKFCFGIYS